MEKKIHCDKCNMDFASEEEMKAHDEKTHSQEKM